MIKKLFAIATVLSLALIPIRSATLTALQADTFTRANASTLGANWTAVSTTAGCQISGNQAIPSTTAAVGTCFFSAADWPNDQGSKVTMSTIAALGTDLSGALVRVQIAPLATNGYYAGSHNIADSHVHLIRIVLGGFTNLATSADTIAVGDTVQIQVQGCNPALLTVLHNGVAEAGMNPFSDTSGLGPCGGSPGILVFSPNSTANAGVTNWTGYAVTSPPTINNSSPYPVLSRGTFTNLGNLTGASQALQFTLPSPTASRIQLIVQGNSGTVTNPIWVLECSQDTGTTWFQVYGLTLPTLAPQLGDIFPIYASYYDVYGLGGASCRFGLGATSGAVTGTLPVFVTIG